MRCCCVPYCSSGYRLKEKENNQKVHFFKLTKDPQLFEKWTRKINRQDQPLHTSDFICSLHFQPEFILAYYEIKMPDGTINKIDCGRVVLKAGTFPTIFIEYPAYLNKTVSFRKFPTERRSPKKKKVTCAPLVDVPIQVSYNNDLIPEINGSNAAIYRITFIMIPELFESLHVENWIICSNAKLNCIMLLQFSADFKVEKKIVILKQTLQIKIFIREIEILEKLPRFVEKETDLEELLIVREVDSLKPCPGSEFLNSLLCRGYCQRSKKCASCTLNDKRKTQQKTDKMDRIMKLRKQNKLLKRKCTKLQQKISKPKQELPLKIQTKNAEKAVSKLIDIFPPDTQQNICDLRKKHGHRYSNRWLYECILMKIQSSKLYRFIRNHNILPLPAFSTIHKRIRCLKACFGFQPNVFEAMKDKAEGIAPEVRRGALLFDEMKLSPKIRFDRNSFKFIGFTDLGRYTPQNQKNQHGDHNLVIMYQPFQGSWIQSIACFLSKGAASGHILTQLIMEAVVLVENSGFFADAETTDGAQWNRGMWTEFGITTVQPSCEHIVDESRQLYFISDGNNNQLHF